MTTLPQVDGVGEARFTEGTLVRGSAIAGVVATTDGARIGGVDGVRVSLSGESAGDERDGEPPARELRRRAGLRGIEGGAEPPLVSPFVPTRGRRKA